MKGLTDSAIWRLPVELEYKAPSCFSPEELWFNKTELPEHFEVHCITALVAEGVADRDCPTIDEWAAFAIAGGIIAALKGKYITPPNQEPLDWRTQIEHHIWEALWQAFQENQEKLDQQFRAAMLREFLPRQHHAPPERPYYESRFCHHWKFFEFADRPFSSIGNIRLQILRTGGADFVRLPDSTRTSIKIVAQHIPQMLDITVARIKKTYHW